MSKITEFDNAVCIYWSIFLDWVKESGEEIMQRAKNEFPKLDWEEEDNIDSYVNYPDDILFTYDVENLYGLPSEKEKEKIFFTYEAVRETIRDYFYEVHPEFIDKMLIIWAIEY